MSSIEVDTLNCKVAIRKYVLVSKPSRWKQESQRVVVQSPMLNISKTILEVPVRRFNGEKENSVCFLPKQDIEKDTSSIYEKAQVSKVTSWVDAHGVALFDSTPSDDFTYCRGHQFWICIGTSTSGYDTSIPVINLQTWEKGNIEIDQVCWSPKIEGPNKQLWTLGGGIRQRRLSGARKFSYYSWAICQQLDGSPAATEIIEIPTKEVKLEDRRWLSTSESRSLFNKILQCMTGGPFADQKNQSESRSRYPRDYLARSQLFVLPTPPTSPGHQVLQLQQLQQLPKKLPSQAQKPFPLPSPWRGIFELSGRTNGRYILRNSLIHPQELALTRSQIRQSLLRSLETASEDIESSRKNKGITVYSTKEPSVCDTRESSAHYTRCSSHSRAENKDGELYNDDISSSAGSEMIAAAEILVGMSANVYLDVASPREAWEVHKMAENPMFTALCSLRDPQCPYTILSTRLHYHCPPEKCKLFGRSSLPSQQLQEGALEDEYGLNHIHCVSRIGAFPDSAGECHLQNSRSRFPNHKCCYWDEEDLKTVPTRGQRACESKKLEEARKKGLQILDRRGLIGNWLDVEREAMMMDMNLDDGGRELEALLKSGLHEVEIARCLFAAEYQGAEGELNF